MPAQPLLEPESCAVEDLGEEIAPVGDDHADGRAGAQVLARVGEHGRDPVHVRRQRRLRRAAAELELAEVREPEQLVRVAVLLVVVDEPGVRRRGDDAVEAAAVVELASVPVEDGRGTAARAQTSERLDPRDRVEPVAREEVRRALHRPALPLVLVAPVRAVLRGAREVEVEVRRQPGRAGGPGEDHAQDVGVLGGVDEAAEGEQLARGPRRVPAADERRRRPGRRLGQLPERVAHVALEREQVVLRGLDAGEQDVERRDVRAGRVPPALERLDERRPRAAEGVEDVPAARDVALEQHLDELRDELAEVRMQRMDVLRPLALGELRLRPGQREVEVRVEGVLRRGHGPTASTAGPRLLARASRSGRRWRRRARGGGGCAPPSAGASRRAPPPRGP